MVAEPGVVEVHDLHVWEVTSRFAALSAHVIVAANVDCHAGCGLERLLAERYQVTHTTLQTERAAERLHTIDGLAGAGREAH